MDFLGRLFVIEWCRVSTHSSYNMYGHVRSDDDDDDDDDGDDSKWGYGKHIQTFCQKMTLEPKIYIYLSCEYFYIYSANFYNVLK